MMLTHVECNYKIHNNSELKVKTALPRFPVSVAW